MAASGMPRESPQKLMKQICNMDVNSQHHDQFDTYRDTLPAIRYINDTVKPHSDTGRYDSPLLTMQFIKDLTS